MSEKKYCIWCGSEIKTESKFCSRCGKKQIEEENQLVDWLIKHTKDKLKGDAESSLFDAIKNFILSHLYGTVMSIAIVSAVGVTVYASEPYITKVESKPGADQTISFSYNANDDISTLFVDYISAINTENNSNKYLYQIDVPDDVILSHHMQLFFEDKKIDTLTITDVQSERKTGNDVLVYNSKSLVEGLDISDGTINLLINYNDGTVYEETYSFVIVHTNNGNYIVTETQLTSVEVSNKPSESQKTMDSSAIRTICNDYLTIVQSADNDPTDSVYNIVAPDSFPIKGDFEVVYDEKFVSTSSFYLRDSSSEIIQKAEEFTMDISKQLTDKDYTVAEYIKEQYIEDAASAEKVYSRTIAFCVVEIEDTPYIAATSIVQYEENENYEWPIEVDTAELESMMTDYINAVFTGGDLTPYEYYLPDESNVTLYRHVLTLPEKCYGFISVDNVHVGLYQRATSLPAGDILDEMGYEKFGADIRITVNEQTEGRQMQTTHNFVFVVIDGQYYAVDDYITTVGHSG